MDGNGNLTPHRDGTVVQDKGLLGDSSGGEVGVVSPPWLTTDHPV